MKYQKCVDCKRKAQWICKIGPTEVFLCGPHAHEHAANCEKGVMFKIDADKSKS